MAQDLMYNPVITEFYLRQLLMKNIVVSFIIMLIVISGCARLDISGIQNLDREKFNPLHLFPVTEPNGLRIDIIRNTTRTNKSDSTITTSLMPYHPLGFSLGNGLFYDLYGNLSLRIDYLLNFSSEASFIVEKSSRYRKSSENFTYSFVNDSASFKYRNRKKIYQKYHIIEKGDSTFYLRKNKLRYSIIKSDTSLTYKWKKRKGLTIYQLNHDRYRLNRRKRDIFQKDGDDIFLGRSYLLRRTSDGKIVNVYKIGRSKNRLLYTLVKGDNKLYIYDKMNRGIKIEYVGKTIEISKEKKVLTKYKLKEKSENY